MAFRLSHFAFVMCLIALLDKLKSSNSKKIEWYLNIKDFQKGKDRYFWNLEWIHLHFSCVLSDFHVSLISKSSVVSIQCFLLSWRDVLLWCVFLWIKTFPIGVVYFCRFCKYEFHLNSENLNNFIFTEQKLLKFWKVKQLSHSSYWFRRKVRYILWTKQNFFNILPLQRS